VVKTKSLNIIASRGLCSLVMGFVLPATIGYKSVIVLGSASIWTFELKIIMSIIDHKVDGDLSSF
jgi:hypothetical protein